MRLKWNWSFDRPSPNPSCSRDGSLGLHQLDPVSEWVVEIATQHVGEFVVPLHCKTDGFDSFGERVKIVDQQGGMGFSGRPELGFDTKVELYMSSRKPAPTARSERLGLEHFIQPQNCDVEPPRGVLAALRHCELNMI